MHTLVFPWLSPPLSANQRLHWARRARLTADVRNATALLARQAGVPAMGRCEVTLVWTVTDKRRRDGGENITPTLKPIIDGLVDAGIVPDDTPEFVERVMPTIRYEPGGTARLEVLIKPLIGE